MIRHNISHVGSTEEGAVIGSPFLLLEPKTLAPRGNSEAPPTPAVESCGTLADPPSPLIFQVDCEQPLTHVLFVVEATGNDDAAVLQSSASKAKNAEIKRAREKKGKCTDREWMDLIRLSDKKKRR